MRTYYAILKGAPFTFEEKEEKRGVVVCISKNTWIMDIVRAQTTPGSQTGTHHIFLQSLSNEVVHKK